MIRRTGMVTRRQKLALLASIPVARTGFAQASPREASRRSLATSRRDARPDSLDVSNSFTTPDAVRMTKADVAAGNQFTLELPPHSVSVITLAITK